MIRTIILYSNNKYEVKEFEDTNSLINYCFFNFHWVNSKSIGDKLCDYRLWYDDGEANLKRNNLVKHLFNEDYEGDCILTVSKHDSEDIELIDFFDEDIWYIENKIKEFLK